MVWREGRIVGVVDPSLTVLGVASVAIGHVFLVLDLQCLALCVLCNQRPNEALLRLCRNAIVEW